MVWNSDLSSICLHVWGGKKEVSKLNEVCILTLTLISVQSHSLFEAALMKWAVLFYFNSNIVIGSLPPPIP